MAGRHGSTLIEWARYIADLRRKLQLTQTELAEKLGVTAMTISRWERGLVEPTAGGYIALGNLADAKRSWYFWRRAGLSEHKLREVIKAANGRRPGSA